MNRTESIIIGNLIGVLCPLTLFFLGWWLVASLSIYRILSISDTVVMASAFFALGIGVVLDVFFVREWTKRFYEISLTLMAAFFLFWSAITIAAFMGVAIFNLIPGALAGAYIGRRLHYGGAPKQSLGKAAAAIGMLTALVIGVISLLVGLMAIADPFTPADLQGMFHLQKYEITQTMIVALVCLGVPILALIQLGLTKKAALLAFRWGGKQIDRKIPRSVADGSR